jgi:hypothetical protein
MKTAFILLLSTLSIMAGAQSNFMSLSFGGILPLGNFASSSDLQKDGFALNGFAGDYSGAWFLKKHLGIGGNIRYASNPVNEKTIADLLKNVIPDIFPDTLTPAIGIGYWRQVAITTGPEVTFGKGRINFDMYALVGINFVMPPDMLIHVTWNESSYSEKLTVRSVSYAVDLGAALRYHLSEKTSLRLYFGYFQSKAKGTMEHTIQIGEEQNTQNEKYNCPIRTLNAGIGLTCHL